MRSVMHNAGAEAGLVGGRRSYTQQLRSKAMLYWAVVFLVVAIIAGVFGFGNIAAGATTIAQVLFFVFLVVFLASLISGLGRRRRHT